MIVCFFPLHANSMLIHLVSSASACSVSCILRDFSDAFIHTPMGVHQRKTLTKTNSLLLRFVGPVVSDECYNVGSLSDSKVTWTLKFHDSAILYSV